MAQDHTPARSRLPAWHRRARQKRSNSRRVISRWLQRPLLSKLQLVQSAVQRLERHHTGPYYAAARRMSQWWGDPKYWKGTWNSGGGKGKGATPTRRASKPKEKDTQSDLFPAYDAMPAGSTASGSGGASSSASLGHGVEAAGQSPGQEQCHGDPR